MITIDTPEARDLIAAAEYGLGRKLEFVREAEPDPTRSKEWFAAMQGMQNITDYWGNRAQALGNACSAFSPEDMQNLHATALKQLPTPKPPRAPWWRRWFGGAK